MISSDVEQGFHQVISSCVDRVSESPRFFCRLGGFRFAVESGAAMLSVVPYCAAPLSVSRWYTNTGLRFICEDGRAGSTWVF